MSDGERARSAPTIHLPPEDVRRLPDIAKWRLARLDAVEQAAFLKEYRWREKRLRVAYLLWAFFFHRFYLQSADDEVPDPGRADGDAPRRNRALPVLGEALRFLWWFLGLSYLAPVVLPVLLVWWVVDFFRMYWRVTDRNEETALAVLLMVQSKRSTAAKRLGTGRASEPT